MGIGGVIGNLTGLWPSDPYEGAMKEAKNASKALQKGYDIATPAIQQGYSQAMGAQFAGLSEAATILQEAYKNAQLDALRYYNVADMDYQHVNSILEAMGTVITQQAEYQAAATDPGNQLAVRIADALSQREREAAIQGINQATVTQERLRRRGAAGARSERQDEGLYRAAAGANRAAAISGRDAASQLLMNAAGAKGQSLQALQGLAGEYRTEGQTQESRGRQAYQNTMEQGNTMANIRTQSGNVHAQGLQGIQNAIAQNALGKAGVQANYNNQMMQIGPLSDQFKSNRLSSLGQIGTQLLSMFMGA